MRDSRHDVIFALVLKAEGGSTENSWFFLDAIVAIRIPKVPPQKCCVPDRPPQGENQAARVENCRADNPGYAGFRFTTNHGELINCYSTISEYTNLGRGHRFLNADNVTNGCSLLVDGCCFDTTLTGTKDINIVIDPQNSSGDGYYDSVEIKNTEIKVPFSTPSTNIYHIIKVDRVLKATFDNVDIITKDASETNGDNFVGYALRFTGLDTMTNELNIQSCDWDQGINFDNKTEMVKISWSVIGHVGSTAGTFSSLFCDCSFVEDFVISNSTLKHKFSLADYGEGSFSNPEIKITNTDFDSPGSVAIFNCPLNSDFFVSDSFTWNTTRIANLPSQRLSTSSSGLTANTMIYVPSGTHETLHPEDFDQITGEAGAKIYLDESYGDPTEYFENGWKGANYWEWTGTHWMDN